MKKLIVLSLAFLLIAPAMKAQDKNVRFGLKATPTFNWYRPDNKKKYENDGLVMKFNWGLALEFKLSDVAAFSTGLEVMYDGGKLNFLDTANYYYIQDDKIIEPSASAMMNDSTVFAYRLTGRKYNTTYVNLPLNIKMKTKDIGGLTYYGLFGATLGIKVKAKSDDRVRQYNYSNGTFATESTIEDLDISKDMGFMRLGLNIGGGVEWNLSGSTSLVFGLNYNMGFTNVLSKNSDYIFSTVTGSGSSITFNSITQKTASHNFALVIGVLF